MTLLWWLDRWRWGVFVAIGVVYAAGLNGRWRITSDSAWYVLQARAMRGHEGAASGVELGATPPGLAMGIAAVGGSAGWGTTIGMLVMAGVVWGLAYRLLIEHADRPTAVLMVLLLALSGLSYEMSLGLLTELPFTAGLLLFLWGHERRLKRRNGLALALGMMVAGVLWMAAFRSVVAVVVGAYVLAEIIRMVGRRDQRKLGLALVGLALAVGILLWSASPAIRDDAGFFFNTLRLKSPEAWWISFRGLMTEALPEAVFGQDVPPVLAWFASGGVVLAGLMLVRTRLLWGVLFGVLLVQWVVFVSDPRYVLPVLALVLFGVWRAGVGVLEKVGEPWRGLGFLVLAVAVLGANVSAVVNTIGEQRSDDFYATYRSGKYAAAVELAEVIRRETPGDAELVVWLEVGLEMAALSDRRLAAGNTLGRAGVVTVGTADQAAQRGITLPVRATAMDERSGERWEARWAGHTDTEVPEP